MDEIKVSVSTDYVERCTHTHDKRYARVSV